MVPSRVLSNQCILYFIQLELALNIFVSVVRDVVCIHTAYIITWTDPEKLFPVLSLYTIWIIIILLDFSVFMTLKVLLYTLQKQNTF